MPSQQEYMSLEFIPHGDNQNFTEQYPLPVSQVHLGWVILEVEGWWVIMTGLCSLWLPQGTHSEPRRCETRTLQRGSRAEGRVGHFLWLNWFQRPNWALRPAGEQVAGKSWLSAERCPWAGRARVLGSPPHPNPPTPGTHVQGFPGPQYKITSEVFVFILVCWPKSKLEKFRPW